MGKSSIFRIIAQALSDGFLKATVWMFIGTGMLSVGNYLYHLLMGRMLGPAEYGVLESLISFSYLLSVPLMTLNWIVVKHVASYKGAGDYRSIASFYHFLNKKFLREGVILCILLALLSPIVASFLHLDSNLMPLLLVAFVFTGLFAILGRGTLQGISNFFGLAIVNSVESISKIVLAVVLVYFGLKSQGGVLAIVTSTAAAYFAARFILKKTVKIKDAEFVDRHLIGKYTIPTFITTLSLTSIFTSDILLARHFLTPEVAGYYAALSILGKVVFFAVSPLTLVMFPFVSERYSQGTSYTKILFSSVGLTVIGSSVIILLYYLFPQVVVGILFGKHFIPISPFVGIFGVFIALYSLCYLIANFFLSIQKTFPTFYVAVAAVFQIVGIYQFHSNIESIIMVSISITFLLLISLLLYYASAIHIQARHR